MRVLVVHQPITLSDGTSYDRGHRVVRADHQAEISAYNPFAQRVSAADHVDLDQPPRAAFSTPAAPAAPAADSTEG